MYLLTPKLREVLRNTPGFLSLLFLVCGAIESMGDSESNAPKLLLQRELPKADLRGYGVVSAKQWTLSEGDGSVLEIVCEDDEHAQLTKSKYLSDLSVSPEITDNILDIEGHRIYVKKVTGQGLIAALRFGDRVVIVAAHEEAEFRSLVQNLPSDTIANLSSTEVEVNVPMWLDRWDRFGFRFYYRPWAKPEGVKLEDYDFLQEFEFAEANGDSGFVIWEYLNPIDSAQGMTNMVDTGWVRRAAREKMLPVGLNISATGKGLAWLKNPYREETKMKMPHYSGSYHKVGDPYMGGTGTSSWNSENLVHNELSELKRIVDDYIQDPNLTSILMPYGELKHGPQDVFMEYGPVADISYRKYLADEVGTVEDINDRWGTQYDSMQEIYVPELASFLGWGPDAIDLSGIWKLGYEPLAEGVTHEVARNTNVYRSGVSTLGAPDAWFAVDFDDSSWGDLEASETDQVMFIEQRPGVLRRTFDVPQAWLEEHSQVWLYLWDLNTVTKGEIKIALNGRTVAEEKVDFNFPHWTAIDVSEDLKSGENLLAIRLPQSMIAYRVYLSPHAPNEYPNLGAEKNAQWVDFIDWIQWSRINVAEKSMNMIRQVTPNHPITLMAPDGYADSMLELAKEYGGNFHNTGYMGAFWADYLPALMRGADLPFSLEPGGPAKNLKEFKLQLGRYFTEGIQGIDYFIHIGSVLWNEKMKTYFEDNLNAIKLLGKYHAPKAEIAALYSTNANAYTSYPWKVDPDSLKAGYWNWNWRGYLQGYYESDALAETSFQSSDVDAYKVIIDSNTNVIGEELLDGIEQYVRQGGVFVTMARTGRHTPEMPDSWPISKLTGFDVANIHVNRTGAAIGLRPAEDEDVFHGNWSNVRANGLSLTPVADDVRALMYWSDGSVAVGVRPLGEGLVIQVGCKFVDTRLFDRLVPQDTPEPSHVTDTRRLLVQLLEWLNIEPIQATWAPENKYALLRHFLSNNGLYDVWVVWNQNTERALKGQIELPNANIPAWCIDVVSGELIEIQGGGIPCEIGPLDTAVYLTPRNQITKAPFRWYELQQNWWRASRVPSDIEYSAPSHPHALSLERDWEILPLGNQSISEQMLVLDYNDSAWGSLDALGIWTTIPEYREVNHAMLRREFAIPSDWNDGRIELSLHSWLSATFLTKGRVWLDGKLILDWRDDGIMGMDLTSELKPGSTHVLALEVDSDAVLAGVKGTAWLNYYKTPEYSIDLAGKWESSQDMLFYEDTIELPGQYDAMNLRRSVFVPEAYKGMRVRVGVDDSGGMLGVLVNGHWLMRFHHRIEERFELDVTPWIRFGSENTIELCTRIKPESGEIRSVTLSFSEPEPKGVVLIDSMSDSSSLN